MQVFCWTLVVWENVFMNPLSPLSAYPVILLQLVMVNPGTDLVKNHESQPQLKQNKESYLGLYVTRRTIWRQTPKLLLQFTEIKM